MKKMMMILALLFAMVGSSFGAEGYSINSVSHLSGKVKEILIRSKNYSDAQATSIDSLIFVRFEDGKDEVSGPIGLGSGTIGQGWFGFNRDDKQLLSFFLNAKNTNAKIRVDLMTGSNATVSGYNIVKWVY